MMQDIRHLKLIKNIFKETTRIFFMQKDDDGVWRLTSLRIVVGPCRVVAN